jgi:hypothetical protein
MAVVDFLSTKRELARADQARRILALSHNIPLDKLKFGELTDLLSIQGTGEGGLPDNRLAELENRIFEIKKEMGDLEEVDPRKQD